VAAFAYRHARAMLDEVDAVDEVALRMQSEPQGAGAIHQLDRKRTRFILADPPAFVGNTWT
jgi:hypothetical protein